MPPVSQAVLQSWSIPPAASFALALTALVYLRGWILLRRARVPFVPPWRAASFLAGLLSLWIALASPLDTFSGLVLTAHMLQHMVLMMVAPPLILLGAPLIPLVRGLPIFAARELAGPFLNWKLARRAGRALTRPAPALLLMAAVMFSWHTPRLYALALDSSAWHEVEHACFFLVSLIFWWPVLQPWPSRPHWPRWAVVPYLMIGDLQNTVLSAVLIFSDRVIYPSYATVPRLFGFSASQDQAAAGTTMWVVGSLAFIVPAVVIAVECLSNRPSLVTVHAPSDREIRVLDTLIRGGRRLWPAARLRAPRWSGRKVEAGTFVFLFALAGVTLAALATGSPADDDQVLLLSQSSGPFTVAVFGPKGDVQAGTVELSILVQSSQTHDLLQDATIDVFAEQRAQARRTASVRASSEDSENKLLQSAAMNIPAEGDWTVHLAVRKGGSQAGLSLPLRVITPEGGFSLPWPYLVLITLAAVLGFAFASRQRKQVRVRISRHQTGPSARLNEVNQ